jgi:hypothetical protein
VEINADKQAVRLRNEDVARLSAALEASQQQVRDMHQANAYQAAREEPEPIIDAQAAPNENVDMDLAQLNM